VDRADRGHDFEVTLGDGHAMVDQHRVEGTCDWLPGMRTATASGNGQTLGLIVAREGLDWLITTHGRRTARARCPRGSRRSSRRCPRRRRPTCRGCC
jgi:hypothetical protein